MELSFWIHSFLILSKYGDPKTDSYGDVTSNEFRVYLDPELVSQKDRLQLIEAGWALITWDGLKGFVFYD